MDPSRSLKVPFCRLEQIVSKIRLDSFVVSRLFVSVLITLILVFSQIERTIATEPPPPVNTTNLEAKSNTFSKSCTVQTTWDKMLSATCSGYDTIPAKNVPRQTEVEELYMGKWNSLQALTDGQLERANLPKLLKLSLRSCQITSIQREAFRGGHRLLQLYLDYNQIEVLDPRVFDGLASLRTLYLAHNPIQRFEVGTVFPLLPSLLRLDISSCALSSIPENTFRKLRNLKRLDLDHNALRTLSWKMIRHLYSLIQVSLENNPWNCDCHVRFLVGIRNINGTALSEMSRCGNVRFLSCAPKVEKLVFRNQNQANEQVQVGDDVNFECTYSGYPPPTVKWRKDGKFIQTETQIPSTNNISKSASGIRMTTQNRTQQIVSKFGVDELERNYNFRQVLILCKVMAEDTGNYECVIENEGGQSEKAVFFKLKDSNLDSKIECDSDMNLRLWIEIAILVTLILVFLLLIVMFARRVCGYKKQNVIMEFGEVSYIREAISQQHLSTENGGTSRSNVSSPLLN